MVLLLIGRDKEVSQVFDDITDNSGASTWLVAGESGIGKSVLLDEIYSMIKDSKAFVGYYRKDQSLIAEAPQSPTYPFLIALSGIINGAKDTHSIEEETAVTKQIKKGLCIICQGKGESIAKIILEDITKKAGIEETLNIGKKFWSIFKSQMSNIMLT